MNLSYFFTKLHYDFKNNASTLNEFFFLPRNVLVLLGFCVQRYMEGGDLNIHI